MPARATIAITPAPVKWARESAGLSVERAAKRAGVRPERLTEWEAREARPTPRQLESLADACKRPVAAFFLPAPPSEPPLPLDFRVLPAAERSALSPITLIAIRRARRLQRVYADLGDDTTVTAPTLPRLRLAQDSERAGSAVRELLGVPFDAAAGREPHDILSLWREAIERVGVLTFQFEMPLREVRGFSLTDGTPAIMLNTKDGPLPRVFTLLHELTHLLPQRPGLCNPDERIEVRQVDAVEVFCNAVAGACLVPADALLARPKVTAHRRGQARLEDVVRDGIATFGVSRYVILRRLRTARVLAEAQYQRTLETWGAQVQMPRKSRGGPAPAVRTVSELGRNFVSRVLRAHERQQITGADVADYLSIRLKHLPRVQALVAA